MSILNTSENGSSASLVTRYASRNDFQFHGKWLIRYDPGEFAYHEILTLLPPLQAGLEQQKLHYKFLNINFNRTIPRSRFFAVGDHLFIRHNAGDRRLGETDPGAFAVQTTLEPLAKPIHSLNLLFPRLEGDPRWKTMGLPAAQLFLASGLQAGGFAATPLPLVLPAGKLPPEAFMADMAGITLFEDLLPFLRPFLASFQAVYTGWLAAGGPFPTLAPLAALYHLPQINLFVRGDAELALPGILNALNQGDLEALFRQSGVFWQQPGLIIMSDFDQVNRPENFSRFRVNLDFLQPGHLRHGLEMNFSRGCSRGCVFCCRVQGRKYRKLPLVKAEELLNEYKTKIEGSIEASISPRQEPPPFHSININDDDILQDPVYAGGIFNLIKKNAFRIIGIQTSPASLLESDGRVKTAVLDLASDAGLYVDGRPLLWLGTDVFLPQRAKRLGKRLPSPESFAKLLAELEKRGLRHFHYWISSDNDSTWEEFIEELALIVNYYRNFPNFGLLAHAPFIVPYPASRLFQRLPADTPNLKIKLDLGAPDPRFSYQVVERLETKYANLNNLLKNEKAGGEFGFFDLLKAKDFTAATQLAYHFLKQEALQSLTLEKELLGARQKLENTIEKLLEL
jgi:hypothetical protein